MLVPSATAQDLPTVLWRKIFSFMPRRQLRSLHFVSRQIRTILTDDATYRGWVHSFAPRGSIAFHREAIEQYMHMLQWTHHFIVPDILLRWRERKQKRVETMFGAFHWYVQIKHAFLPDTSENTASWFTHRWSDSSNWLKHPFYHQLVYGWFMPGVYEEHGPEYFSWWLRSSIRVRAFDDDAASFSKLLRVGLRLLIDNRDRSKKHRLGLEEFFSYVINAIRLRAFYIQYPEEELGDLDDDEYKSLPWPPSVHPDIGSETLVQPKPLRRLQAILDTIKDLPAHVFTNPEGDIRKELRAFLNEHLSSSSSIHIEEEEEGDHSGRIVVTTTTTTNVEFPDWLDPEFLRIVSLIREEDNQEETKRLQSELLDHVARKQHKKSNDDDDCCSCCIIM